MDSGGRQYHYVKPNETTRIPRRHIVIHAAARSTRTSFGHEQTWRGASGWFVSAPKGKTPKETTASWTDPATMWSDIVAHAVKGTRTVLWAHNLGFQARVSGLFRILPGMGWELIASNMAARGCWMTWRKDTATLTMTDVGSVWPTTVAEIGKMFRIDPSRIPDQTEPDETWLTYNRRTVNILSIAVASYLGWIESADLGNWQMTGAGQSWAAYRHKHMHHKLLVHADVDAMVAERRAMWTGRCEAYWHGTILNQVLHEWDLSLAYARVARDVRVPTRLIGPMPPRYDWRGSLDDPRYAFLAEVTVDTETPTVPALHDDHILWPVGKFSTVLWDCEIAEAIADGATVTVHKGWLYYAEPALKSWAEWVIAALEDDDGIVPAWQKAIFKHWARALIGRFAMQYATWDQWATMPTMDAERRVCIDELEGTVYELMHVGAQMFRQAGTEDWGNSMAAITGYVMAASRVRLWRIMKALPKGATLYVDTDSILATDAFHADLARVADSSLGHGLRLKTSYTGFTIDGPRQIVTGPRVRMGGIPVRANRTGRHSFEGEVYESVDVALRHKRADVVRAVDRTWTVRGVDRRRSGPSIGWTKPFRLGLDGPCCDS